MQVNELEESSRLRWWEEGDGGKGEGEIGGKADGEERVSYWCLTPSQRRKKRGGGGGGEEKAKQKC